MSPCGDRHAEACEKEKLHVAFRCPDMQEPEKQKQCMSQLKNGHAKVPKTRIVHVTKPENAKKDPDK